MSIVTIPSQTINPTRSVLEPFVVVGSKPTGDTTRAVARLYDNDSSDYLYYNGNKAEMVAFPDTVGSDDLYYFDLWPMLEARFYQLNQTSYGTPLCFWVQFAVAKLTAPNSCRRSFDVEIEYFNNVVMTGYTVEESESTETSTAIQTMPAYAALGDIALHSQIDTATNTQWLTRRPLTRLMGIADSDGMAIWRRNTDLNAFRITAYTASSSLWYEIIDISSEVADKKVLVLTTGPAQIRNGFVAAGYTAWASFGSPTLANVAYYILDFGKYDAGYTQWSQSMRVNISENCAEKLALHFVNSYGQCDTMNFYEWQRTNAPTVELYRRDYPAGVTDRLSQISLGQFGGKANTQYKVTKSFVSKEEFVYLQDLFTSPNPMMQLYDGVSAVFIPVTITVEDYQTNTSANNYNGVVQFTVTVSHQYNNA